MKIEKRENNVCDWKEGMALFTISDIKKYLYSLKSFSFYEANKNRITIAEHEAIEKEIEAWNNIIGLINRLKISNTNN